MKILIAGGTGLIGSAIIDALSKAHDISVITRDKNKAHKLFPNIDVVDWQDIELKKKLERSDLVINLVGKSIGDNRWSSQVKKEIIESRVKTTKQLCELINQLDEKDRSRLFNASAIGVYGLQDSIEQQNSISYDEDFINPDPAHDFVSTVCTQLEAVLDDYKNLNIVKLRFAVVLSPKGGMLKKVLLPYKFGLGGKVGTGRQPFSWIAIEDVVGIISYLIDHPEINGSVNLVAPEVVSQTEFSKAFAKKLRRPDFMPMPSFIVKMLFGQMGHELLLSGQRVKSKRLAGYDFKFPTLASAMNHWDL